MLQLTDIAIPRMLLQLQLGSFGKGKRSLVVLLGKTLYEEFCQRDDIFLPFTQRRYFEVKRYPRSSFRDIMKRSADGD